MAVKPIPDGYHSVTPYLTVHDGAAALEFYQQALGAVEFMRIPAPEGKIGHAEFRVGDSTIMLASEFPNINVSPKKLGGSPVGLMVYVEDVDAQFAQAIAAGGKVIKPLQDQFYGDRSGTFEDPFGHQWTLSTHKEDLSPEEIEKRAAAMPS